MKFLLMDMFQRVRIQYHDKPEHPRYLLAVAGMEMIYAAKGLVVKARETYADIHKIKDDA